MKKPADTLGSYVRKVHEGTQRYAQDLLAENDRLRVLAATLENDRARLEERVRSRDDVVRELDRLRESIAAVESDKQRAQQLLLSACEELGIDPAAHAAVPVGAGRIGRTAATGTADIGASTEAPSRPQEQDLTACVPLKLDGRVTGALALFRLLPQKAGFETIDHELFDLLATHAATALYCTRLHEGVEAPRP
jgi:GAF domain-containing protein